MNGMKTASVGSHMPARLVLKVENPPVEMVVRP